MVNGRNSTHVTRSETGEHLDLHASPQVSHLYEELFCATDDRQSNSTSATSRKCSDQQSKPPERLVTNSREEPLTRRPIDYSKINGRKAAELRACDPNAHIEPDLNDPNWPLANRRLETFERWMSEAENKFDQYDINRDGFLHSSELAVINQGWSDYLSASYDQLRDVVQDKQVVTSRVSTYFPPFYETRFSLVPVNYMGVSKGDVMSSFAKPTPCPEVDARCIKNFGKIINDRSIDDILKKYKKKP